MRCPASRFDIRSLDVRRGDRCVLDAIDVSFEPGRVTAVLGPNGAGKSTLLACLAGLLQPQEGRIDLDGAPLGALTAERRAQRIAFLPQSPEIVWAVDVETLVGLGRLPFHGVASEAQNRAAVQRAMDCTQVTPWAKRAVTTLSGGERARVLLARLLAGESDWILADEPFTGLDPAHQFEAAELLRTAARRGVGVILTIHDLTLAARIADRVVVLHTGRVVADGAPTQALSPATLRHVYGIEAEWLDERGSAASPLIAIHGKCA